LPPQGGGGPPKNRLTERQRDGAEEAPHQAQLPQQGGGGPPKNRLTERSETAPKRRRKQNDRRPE